MSASQLLRKAEEMIHNNHSETDQIRTLGEKVSEKWQKLVHHAQERHKLVMASNNWFKTADQVESYKTCFLKSPYLLLMSVFILVNTLG